MTKELAFLSQARSWDAFYTEAAVAEFRRRLYLEAFGEEYPADEATDGYITRSELRDMVGALQVGRGQKIADLGCGPRRTRPVDCGCYRRGAGGDRFFRSGARPGASASVSAWG